VPAASPASHAAHERRLISQLCRAAGTAIISASHRRGDELLTPAPALGHIPRGAPAELVTRHPAAVTEQLAWRGEFEAMADPPPAVGPEETVRGGTRLLQLEAQCPARAFFELRLHARELRVPAFGIDALTRGELVHDALQALYQALREAGIEPGAAAARGLVPAIAEASLRGRLPPSRLNQVLEELEARRLASLLEAMLEFDARRAPFQVVATELPLDVPVAGLVLRVRADRVDELTDGSRLIIDYKTGVAKRRSGWLGERPAEPQLPLYALGGQADGVAFVYLNENGVTADGVAATDAEMQGLHAVGDLTRGRLATWEELAGEWSTALAMLAKEFLAGCCRIDADAPELADGQYAPLSRLHDLGVRP
jgi:RecB family exonuclease